MAAEGQTAGRARLHVVLTAVLFSTGGAAIKAIQFDGWQTAGLRSAIAALALLTLLPEARRGWGWRPALVGGIYGVTMILFVQANKLTTAANTIYLQATAPLYALLLGPWLLKELVRRRDLLFMTALAAGLAMFFAGADVPSLSAPRPLLGNLLATACGVTWALTLVGLRWLGKGEGSPAAAVVAGNLVAVAVCLPAALPLPPAPPGDWVLVTYLGVFQIGLAYVFLTRALRVVPVLEASLLLLIEPVLSPIWAWILHREVPAGWSLAGCAVILVATAVQTSTAGGRTRAV